VGELESGELFHYGADGLNVELASHSVETPLDIPVDDPAVALFHLVLAEKAKVSIFLLPSSLFLLPSFLILYFNNNSV
jgi:hypothetical protein